MAPLDRSQRCRLARAERPRSVSAVPGRGAAPPPRLHLLPAAARADADRRRAPPARVLEDARRAVRRLGAPARALTPRARLALNRAKRTPHEEERCRASWPRL